MSADIWWPLVLSAALVVVACLAVAIVNARHNERIGREAMLLLRDEDMGPATMVEGPDSGVGALPPAVPPLSAADQDDAWADQLAAMNAEHLTLVEHLERVHPPEACQEWCCWERRLQADQAAWLELVRADVTVVAEWIVAGAPGPRGFVPAAQFWPGPEWRGDMVTA